MRKPSIYSLTHEIVEKVAWIWRAKTQRGMDPDAIEAMLHEITVCLRRYERKIQHRMFRAFHRPHNN